MDMNTNPSKSARDMCEQGVGMACQGIYKEAETNGNLERAEKYAEDAIGALQGALKDIRTQMSE